MGAACYVDGKLYDDCMGEISMSPGHCYEGNYTGEDEDVLEYVAVCCSVKYYMEYSVSMEH